MRTLYIHGLDSIPAPEKLKILQDAGMETYALHLDYRNQHDAYYILKKHATRHQVKFIVGSSLGGFYAYWLAEELGLPCLLFNPALANRSLDAITPQLKQLNCPARYVVIGAGDEVIEPQGSLDFLERAKRRNIIQKVMVCQWLAHRIDFNTFREMVNWSLENIYRIA